MYLNSCLALAFVQQFDWVDEVVSIISTQVSLVDLHQFPVFQLVQLLAELDHCCVELSKLKGENLNLSDEWIAFLHGVLNSLNWSSQCVYLRSLFVSQILLIESVQWVNEVRSVICLLEGIEHRIEHLVLLFVLFTQPLFHNFTYETLSSQAFYFGQEYIFRNICRLIFIIEIFVSLIQLRASTLHLVVSNNIFNRVLMLLLFYNLRNKSQVF